MQYQFEFNCSRLAKRLSLNFVFALCVLLFGLAPAVRAQQVFTSTSTSETTSTVAAFRVALTNAGATVGAIGWDGVRLDGTDNNGNTTPIVANKITGIPINRFQVRGVIFNGVTAVANDGFVSANAGVADQFPAFSPANTFSGFNSNRVELSFVLPSAATTTPVPAATRGFGVVFLDVERANTSSIEYFNGQVSLGRFFVPTGASGQAQFLGVLFGAPIVTRVVITTGTAALFNFNSGTVTAGAPDQTVNAAQNTDQVAMDDFIIADPISATTSNVATAFSAVGTTAATSALAAFRTAITNANATPSAITWDGVLLNGTDNGGNTTVIVPNKITGIPSNRFQVRGALFGQISAVSGDGFVSANPSVADQFPAFSPANTFAAINNNRYAVNFVLASAATTVPIPASSRGFGAIFLDVEREGTSSLEFFNGTVSLGKFFVPPGASGQPEFLGVLFNAPIVTHVFVTAGTAPVFNFQSGQVSSGGSENATTDLAVVDDFLFAEPTTTTASVSAASFSGAALAPDSIVALFGAELAPNTVVATTTPLPTTLAGTSVKIKDSLGAERTAQLFFVSAGQINYLLPAQTAPGDAVVTVTTGDGRIATGRIRIETVAPALFAANANGQGVAAAVVLRVRANGEQVYEPAITFDAATQRFVAVPIDLGPASDLVYLILYGTGVRFRSGLQGVTVKLGNADGNVLYAGGQTGFAGLDQLNVGIPRSLIGSGEIPVVLTVDGKTANTLRVNIK